MFFFTKSWPPKAVYSGRFAFVTELTPETAQKRLSDAWENAQNGMGEDPILEEMKHARLFLNSPTGLALNGVRFFVRLFWVLFHSSLVVKIYYRLRTRFYIAAFGKHEEIVKTSQKNKPRYIVPEVEARAVWGWMKYDPLAFIVLLITSPVLILIGWLVAREPAVITAVWKDGELVDRNFSLKGLFNIVGSDAKPNQGFLRCLVLKLLSLIQVERFGRQTFEDDLEWLKIKAEVESRLYGEFRSKISDQAMRDIFPTDYEEYLGLILTFVAQWIPPGKDWKRDWIRIRYVMDLVFGRAKLEPWARNDPMIKRIVNFSYMHGN